MLDLITYQQAKQAGETYYFTGKPCKRGHIARRAVKNCGCLECIRITDSAYKKRNVAKCSAKKREWCAKHRDKVRAIKRKWNAENDKEGQKRRSRRWYLANKDKANDQHREYAKRRPDVTTARAAKYRASRLQQMPVWADAKKIKGVYFVAKERTRVTGLEHHVDHIIPLRGKTVCGLHVQNNLCILLGHINRSKGNRLLYA